ncbi:MAG: ATP-binding protein [Myxococcota bacterium]
MAIENAQVDNSELQDQLSDAKQTLQAIREGSVDAVVVDGPRGPAIYTLEGPDEPFRTFVEEMQEGAITLSREGTLLYANSFFAALIGCVPFDVIGRPLLDFVAPEFRYTCRSLIEQGLARPIKGNVRLCRGSENISVQLTLSPLNRSESPTCCGVVFDLREREQADAANAAREAAEQANAAKDRFLAVLSHELRSPLNAVLGWAQILGRRGDFEDGSRRALQAIERNARVQAQLIADLLDISRIVMHKLHLEMEVADFKAIVESAVQAARLALAANGKALTISASVPDADVYLYGDPARLQQVVTNLLNNAMNFTDSGGRVELELSLAGDNVILRVSDTGVGIEPSQLAHIFDAFHQAATDLNHRKGGLGLGLAIARQIAEAHGGRIEASSAGAGKGSTFTLGLGPIVTPSFTQRSVSSEERELSKIQVLLVDDESDTLDVTRYLLEGAGATVETADSAAAALEVIQKRPVDVLVSDIGLPVQDGFALMREVRARGFAADTLPAIALTGYASSSDARRSTAAGFQMHMAKPVDAQALVRAIKALWAAKGTRQQLLAAGSGS